MIADYKERRDKVYFMFQICLPPNGNYAEELDKNKRILEDFCNSLSERCEGLKIEGALKEWRDSGFKKT